MSKKYKYRWSSFPRDVLGSSDNFDYERDQDFRSTLPEITCGESNSVSGIPVKRTASHGILLIYSTRNFRTFLIKSFAFGKYYNFGIFRKFFRKNSCTICVRFESFEIFGGMVKAPRECKIEPSKNSYKGRVRVSFSRQLTKRQEEVLQKYFKRLCLCVAQSSNLIRTNLTPGRASN